jgi:peptide/nickel transport system permease protein
MFSRDVGAYFQDRTSNETPFDRRKGLQPLRAMIFRRAIAFIPTLIVVALLTFALEHMVPGGPAEALVGISGGGAQTIALLNRELGLDHPLASQFVSYLNHLIHGQFGESYINSVPVSTLISQRLPPSVEIILGALILSVLVGGAAGMLAAVKRRSWVGRLALTLSGVGLSFPDFWLGSLAAGFVGVYLKLLPATGYQPIGDGLVGNMKTVIMPVIVLAIPTSAFICRHFQSSLKSALESPYVRTSWAMGVKPRKIYLDFALRNAVAPIINFLPLVVSGLIGGMVVVEYIFGIPGLGSEIVTAVTDRDYLTLQAIVLLIAVVVLVLNLLADIAIGVIDPRTHSKEDA